VTSVRPAIERDPPDLSSLEGRTSLGLTVLAALNGSAVLLGLVSTSTPTPQLWRFSFSLASGLLIVIFLIESRGLRRWRPWAVALARPLLIVLIVAGGYQLVATALHGHLRIPFDIAIAVWALRGGLETTPRPELRGPSVGALAGAVVLSAVMAFAEPLFEWGGALDVREPDLHTTMAVDCGKADAAGVPAVITITYDWSWTNSSPLPDGLDAIVLGWEGDDSVGRPLYLIGPTPQTIEGVYPGRFGAPSQAMEQAIRAESRGAWHWGIELGERGFEPGHLVATLERTRAAQPGSQPVRIKATYIHLGVFRQDVPTVTCSW
jgi:hypothetical protein